MQKAAEVVSSDVVDGSIVGGGAAVSLSAAAARYNGV